MTLSKHAPRQTAFAVFETYTTDDMFDPNETFRLLLWVNGVRQLRRYVVRGGALDDYGPVGKDHPMYDHWWALAKDYPPLVSHAGGRYR